MRNSSEEANRITAEGKKDGLVLIVIPADPFHADKACR